ncbi:MAG: GntR family transcriptional regulator [Alphaproteobacteria bacterium]
MVPSAPDSQPLYVRVSHALSEAIAANRFPVGTLLPTEEELSREFSVSRHTVRAAIRELRAGGLLSARRGIGTRVEARQKQARYAQLHQSISEILQYARETRLEVIRADQIVTESHLANRLGCRTGKLWHHIEAIRRPEEEGPPICFTDIYLDKRFSGIVKDIGVQRTAVYALIEQKYGETIVEVQQDIEATLIPAARARHLEAAADAPALLITRRYFGTGSRLIEVSLSLHPADRFVYSARLKRDLT